MEPQYGFCTSADGTRIAFSTLGGGPLPANISVWGWAHLQEWIYSIPEYFAFERGMAQDRCVVKYDRRGVGGSERAVHDLSLDAQVADVRAIVEHLGLKVADLQGIVDGTPVAMAYAARYPDAVRRLALWSPYARGADAYDPARMHSLADLMRSDWSLGRRTFASLLYSRGPLLTERQRALGVALRDAVTPELAARYMESETDVRALLPSIRCPALVLERRVGISAAASRASREVAAQIPGARRVMTRGDNSMEDQLEQLEIIREFFGEERVVGDAPASGVRTVLFTDLVGHTEMMRRLGDAQGREVLRDHEHITRDAIERHGGTEIKTDGDSFMVSFGSVAAAMECAVGLQRAFAARNAGAGEPLRVRMGLNAGEPVEDEGDLFGETVILAARIKDQADEGEILIAEPVRHLLSGKGFVFADRGEFVPKGFEDAVRLFEVRWRE